MLNHAIMQSARAVVSDEAATLLVALRLLVALLVALLVRFTPGLQQVVAAFRRYGELFA